MKRIILILCVVCSSALYASPIDYHLTLSSGLGTFDMGDLKKLNTETVKNLPFNSKLVDDFPPFMTFSGEASFTRDVVRLGFVLGFASTGSRIAYSDYSGTYNNDIKAHCFSIGFNAATHIIEIGNKIDVRGVVGLGLIASYAKISESIVLGNTSSSDSKSLECSSVYFLPELRIAYKLSPSFEIGAYGAYMLDFTYNYYYKGDRIQYYSKWSGIRSGAFLAYNVTL